MTGEGRRIGVLRALGPALVCLFLGACGVLAPRSNPGFAEFDSLGIGDTDRTVALSIGPALLRIAARHTEEDPETQALLRALDGVRVRVYELTGDGHRVERRLQRMSTKLEQDGWTPVALVHGEDEVVHMLLRSRRTDILGMVVMVVDDTEAVLVNVMGNLPPEMFGQAMVALDLHAPDVVVASVD